VVDDLHFLDPERSEICQASSLRFLIFHNLIQSTSIIMNPEQQNEPRPDGEDVQLTEDDVVEVVEDDGPAGEPMSDDDFDGYDGEIVIGAPAPGEEEEYMRSIEKGEDMEGVETMEDNSWSASGELSHVEIAM
jgi:hypothetical protein